MHRRTDSFANLFAGEGARAYPRSTEPVQAALPFGAGDRAWQLELIDARFVSDPLFDSAEELVSRPDLRPRSGRRVHRARAAVLSALLAGALSACAPDEPAMHTGDSILVRLKPGALVPAELMTDDSGPSIQPLTDLAAEGEEPLLRLPVPVGVSVEEFVQQAESADGVDYAEPVHLYRTSKTANDPRLKDLWGMTQIEAPAAWDKTTGSKKVVVAVVDDGVALDHPDLAPNLWTNPDETPGNQTDDDGDGFVDDVHGYDFVDGEGDPSPASQGAERWHGTHVSGTIGAAGNNGVGVVGVNWQVSLMALRALGPDGGRADDLARAIDYATDHGARVINASWGGGGASQTLSRAIARAGKQGVLFAVAAGNDGGAKPEYPANLNLDNVLSVGALGPDGKLAAFSNRGALVAAPGVGILSTTAPGRYERYDGTSMATPHVAGIAALLWARRPDATLAQVRDAIIASGQAVTGSLHGSVSAARALAALEGASDQPPSLHLSRTELAFSSTADKAPRTQVVSLRAESGASIAWTASADAPWISLPRTSGMTPSRLSVRIDPSGLRAGNHKAKITVSPEVAGQTAAVLTVSLQIEPKGASTVATGSACAFSNGAVRVKAGTICRLTAPGLDPQAKSVGVGWKLPTGQTLSTGTFSARFVRAGTFQLRIRSDGGADEEVPVVVE